jgi:hypothetical protein
MEAGLMQYPRKLNVSGRYFCTTHDLVLHTVPVRS